MNLGDPQLELIDPTPNVHSLFIHFDKIFFWSKLASRAAVRWSKRMYSCAGTCSYECRAGFCDIALSEPLLKLRSRKDLVETLLHEMIHAFLFVTGRDRDRDGHGPNFQSHMFRINKLAGVNITIYHDFHDEVKLYQTHWWRCNGPCQKKSPYFGMVRRTVNRVPGPSDFWWNTHQKFCGGTFVKVKEPEKACLKKPLKSYSDITKYIINNKSTSVNSKSSNQPKNITKGILQNVNNPSGIGIAKRTKNDFNGHIQKVNVFKDQDKKLSPILNKGSKVEDNRRRTQSVDVADVVRNVWANKQLPGMEKSNITVKNKNNDIGTSNDIINIVKHKSEDVHLKSPPNKIRKIDNHFVNVAKKILKDVYGEDFEIKVSEKDNKLVPVKVNFVDCPICGLKFKEDEINRHLDECLNKDIIEELSKGSKPLEIISSVIMNNRVGDKKLENTRKSTHTDKQNNLKHVNLKMEIIDNLHDINNKSVTKKETSHLPDKLVLQKGKARRSDGYVSACVMKSPKIEVDPGTSKNAPSDSTGQTCPCCDVKIVKPMEEHLDECLAFTEESGGATTSFANDAIVINDDDDIFDETLTLNSTGTKNPCPCCLKMIERDEIHEHLDMCLSS